MSGSIKRPACSYGKSGSAVVGIIAFSCGVILLYWLSILPPPEWLIAAILLLTLTLSCSLSPVASRLTVFALGLFAGLFWASWHAGERLSTVLPASLERERLSVSGYLCDIPSPGSFNSLRFSLCITQWHNLPIETGQEARMPDLLKLSWYGHGNEQLPGARLRLEVVLKRPHGSLNPAGFRYEDWLFRTGYRATGSVRSVQSDPAVRCLLHCQYRSLHLSLKNWTTKQFGDARHFPLVSSLLIGHRGQMEQNHWDVLKATGTIHLVAISGLHLGLVALGAGFLCRRLLLALPARSVSDGARRRIVFTAVLSCCLIYALAAGFTVPTRRALVMVVAGGWLVLMSRQAPVWQAFLAALAAVLVLDPFAPLDQGFWLSFTAVAILIAVFSARLAGTGSVTGLVVAQLAVFGGLWPILAIFGQGQPLVGLLANLAAIPWVSLVVMPILVTGGLITAVVPGAAQLFVPLFDLALGVLWYVLTWFSEWQAPDMAASVPEIVAWALLTITLVFIPFARFRFVAALLAVSWLMYPGPTSVENPDLRAPEIRFWDVGQGLSVLVRQGREVLVYDTGPAVPGVFSAVESTLLPNLEAEGIRRIDTLVVSHADSDHAGGVAELIRQIEVGRVIAGEPIPLRHQVADLSVSGCKRSSQRLGSLILEFWQGEGVTDGNDASCLVRIYHPESGTEWLLPGDITQPIEAQYLAYLAAREDFQEPVTRVLVAPHHGSKTSSSEAWVRALRPDQVIYTAGYRHRYGHPHPTVTARYAGVGAVPLNTACSGSIVMTIEDNQLALKEMRHGASFWIGGPGLARDQCKIP
ncbi:competence protein ComEC [Marinobacter sp. es.048]|uniref:DNA internalization-related competence protein ComEC/Rec2 n=1 Tax=Marinobacter sp. es.048 TaxID=1761795 RepID=UPI000B6D63AD|nr:DNA internalization-related competence protein ComEC/Rec2 [Marinobacter sp. es.048]SNC67940.1 competence protein ComEC [Marinobacter sp. es.048]